jgi:hypothetical protein
MKRSAIALLVTASFLHSCAPPAFDEHRCHNCGLVPATTRALLDLYRPLYHIYKQDIQENSTRMENTPVPETILGYAFKGKRPRRRNEQGAWYHRFKLQVLVFATYQEANRYMNGVFNRFYGTDPEFRGKLWGPCYYMLCGNRVYEVSGPFYVNRQLDKNFDQLLHHVTGGRAVEPGTVLTTQSRTENTFIILQ